ncbi:aromatic ring-hydroxylating dioxygenase subunit alpha [Pelomonas sp. KK5]|uniref:aromatic ring-hydroxylating dioxygenase subunit alpha n=1 Tax=Pelomonas sp. KK5 TaxID=1855730 RepID=UPI00097C613B|nr:aromatic ring-hydroxylating dioxygenase subunit alpha [Pelomonas sp. KK5]
MSLFLRNCWYVIGWAHELAESGAMVHRTIAGEEILVYRLQKDGSIAAIQDRCPHRFVPLHKGRQVGDHIECGYHGLCFGASGQCVRHPVDGAVIPKAAQVKSYAATERHGALWVWLGDAAAADPSRIADLSFLTDPQRSTVSGHMHTKANYELAIDNLVDLTHIEYVHREFQASEAFPRLITEVQQDGDVITTRLTYPNGRPPPVFANAGLDMDQPIDLVNEVEWHAPSVAILRVRAYRPGRHDEVPIFDIKSAHLISAETQGSCHYFFGNTRNYALNDPAVDEKIRHWQRTAFIEQDKPMLEAQQQYIGERDILAMKPVLLATDAGSVRIRRTLRRMIEAEQPT